MQKNNWRQHMKAVASWSRLSWAILWEPAWGLGELILLNFLEGTLHQGYLIAFRYTFDFLSACPNQFLYLSPANPGDGEDLLGPL